MSSHSVVSLSTPNVCAPKPSHTCLHLWGDYYYPFAFSLQEPVTPYLDHLLFTSFCPSLRQLHTQPSMPLPLHKIDPPLRYLPRVPFSLLSFSASHSDSRTHSLTQDSVFGQLKHEAEEEATFPAFFLKAALRLRRKISDETAEKGETNSLEVSFKAAREGSPSRLCNLSSRR